MLKQTFYLLRKNPFITVISVAGTAVAIMMIMVILMVEMIKTIPIAPENNRDKTLYIRSEMYKNKSSTNCGLVSYKHYNDYLRYLENAKLKTLLTKGQEIIKTSSGSKRMECTCSYCDDNYWKFISFDFVEGTHFNREDFAAGLNKAVISQKLSEELYGKKSAVGKTFILNNKKYSVVGIVENISPIFPYAYSDIWIPYTSSFNYEKMGYSLLLLMDSKKDKALLTQEVREIEQKFTTIHEGELLTYLGPYSQREQVHNKWNNSPTKITMETIKLSVILFFLFLIPALNLSGFNLSRIKKRTEEIGIRKAFGATKRSIIRQMLQENLITTLIGGVLGLLLSYIALYFLRNHLFIGLPADAVIPLNAIVSPYIFLVVFLACILLSVISTIVPALRAAKFTIAESIRS
ncbi:ABC transporter permease [Bacteroidales bacterium OttesenSCG-928-B11]|nr:ABC transporter permease [Bacteroidales bacterium OttesenSCG-928-E04]MDL2307966.1 ABC transporter permease [Bacteroidales bacterium OttesenSCG-928-C03]MDL2311673.1 ABC transporter permease [Bacteroidales bacterium OttesenSCG-928-B11]MDL2325756.1 ABC transporter permease [Bacteroidales bacterium OttesenSCG-928-A14]